MSVIGTPKDWAGVIDSRVPDIIRLVIAAWKRIPPGAPDEREDLITNRLCVALQRSRTARKMMFYIQYQPVELDPATGDEFGRMDIAFYPTGQPWVPSEDVYFCLECKRLNVIRGGTTRGYANEYVTFGIMRFVTGQYSRAVLHGGMIGYVRDGDVSRAMTNIEAGLHARHTALGMKAPGEFGSSMIVPRLRYVRETHHQRRRGEPAFCIHHLFMAGRTYHASRAPSMVDSSVQKKRGRRKAAK